MDIKSILRTFRYTELQAKADRDPSAKRPPTIKFLAVALFVALIGFGFAMLVMNFDAGDGGDGTVLTVSDPTATNSTAPAPTSEASEAPTPQQAPSSVLHARGD